MTIVICGELSGRAEAFRPVKKGNFEGLVVKRKDGKYKPDQTLWYKVLNPIKYVALPDDSEALARWRQRMGSEAAKEIYKRRAATAECVNVIARGRGLSQFLVRGLHKVKAVALWYALAHNLMWVVTLTQRA